jgi:hypothetical protein
MRDVRRAILIALLLLYGAILIRYTCYAAGGSDSSGYLNAARLIAKGQAFVRVAPLDTLHLDNTWRVVFVPLGFSDAPTPRDLVPSYPLGYPLHELVLGVLFGWKRAPFLATPIAALLAIVLTYRVARLLRLDRNWSLAAAALLAIAPSFLFMAVQPMSDVTATLWCTAAIFFALRAVRHPRYAALCGVAFAIAVWVRPSNLLLAVAIGIAMRWRWRLLALSIAGAVPFAVALMIVNHALYGSALSTGYGSMGGLMSFSNLATHLPHYAKWLAILETPIVFPGALLVAFDGRVGRWQRALLLIWFGAFFGFYIFYQAYDAWWYTRFLLPAFPALLIAMLLVLRDVSERWHWPKLAPALLVAVIAAQSLHLDAKYSILQLHEGERIYLYASRWAEKLLPPDALPAAMQLSGSLFYYDNRFSARYDNITAQRFQELRAYAGVAGLHWYAVVFDWEVPLLQKNMPGRWTKIDANRDVLLLRLDS